MADIGRQGAVQFLLTLCVFFVMFVLGHCTLDLACIEVKKAYTEKGLNENEVPIQAISGKSAVMIINEIDLLSMVYEVLMFLIRKRIIITYDFKQLKIIQKLRK